jgi:hypothetical protein
LDEGEPMRVWLTVGEDGKGVLTGEYPVIARIRGTRRHGVYAQPGDWLLVRSLCLEGVEMTLGYVPATNEPVRVDLQILPISAEVEGGQPAEARSRAR